MLDPASIAAILAPLGYGVAANAVYDEIRRYFATEPHPTADGLAERLRSRITIEDQHVWAERLIEVLAAQGHIIIRGSQVSAPGLNMAAEHGNTIAVEGSSVRGGGIAIESGPAGRLVLESEPGGRVLVEGGDGRLRFKT
jgi:hypothetical protein